MKNPKLKPHDTFSIFILGLKGILTG